MHQFINTVIASFALGMALYSMFCVRELRRDVAKMDRLMYGKSRWDKN